MTDTTRETVERLIFERDEEDADPNGCKQIMPINGFGYPCQETCPCALRDMAITLAEERDEITRLRGEVERLQRSLATITLLSNCSSSVEEARAALAELKGEDRGCVT